MKGADAILSTHQQPLKPITQTGEAFDLMYEVLLHPNAQKVYANADKAFSFPRYFDCNCSTARLETDACSGHLLYTY